MSPGVRNTQLRLTSAGVDPLPIEFGSPEKRKQRQWLFVVCNRKFFFLKVQFGGLLACFRHQSTSQGNEMYHTHPAQERSQT
jgi:hypothetical protein